ncbi:HEPN family nuclease [Anaerorhabdus sp.]|uniref:HEPN family nuclease n=1 Tax=Anaerorhabdus sp. TaxID=1872524 RepID=UPI002FC6AAB7
MSNYTNFSVDFPKRTIENLKFIESQKSKGNTVYEVTQLINSLLGLFIFIKEREDCSRIFGRLKQKESFKKLAIPTKFESKPAEFITGLRNGIAHGRVFVKGSPEIDTITIQCAKNKRSSMIILANNDTTLSVECSCKDLRNFIIDFANLMTDYLENKQK